MPIQKPILGWEHIRNYAEKWQWREGAVRKTDYNVPERYRKSARQVPYYIRAVTLKGELIEGEVITLKVFTQEAQRLIKFVNSNEIRRICDFLIIEIDGVRFIAH